MMNPLGLLCAVMCCGYAAGSAAGPLKLKNSDQIRKRSGNVPVKPAKIPARLLATPQGSLPLPKALGVTKTARLTSAEKALRRTKTVPARLAVLNPTQFAGVKELSSRRQTLTRSFPPLVEGGAPPIQNPLVWDALLVLKGSGPHVLSSIDFTHPPSVPPFDCNSVHQPGFYADVNLDCRVYHRCDIRGGLTTYLVSSSPTVVFNQITLTPDWYYNVDCSKSADFFDYSNARLYHRNWPLFDDSLGFTIEPSQIDGLEVNTPVNTPGERVIDHASDGTPITGYAASIDSITINVVAGTNYPITCSATLATVTADDPNDLTIYDSIPANVISRLGDDETIPHHNDPVASTSQLRYIAVEPSTGRVIIDAQVLNGTDPEDTPTAFILCASSGFMRQTYNILCTDSVGRESNTVQITIRYPVCRPRLKIGCDVTTCAGVPPTSAQA
ncbi:hypothetical protein BV898_07542 [Hypsibius exemplaris]|uniref:Uncharacterized protein n=1 Tax=Hypsibius exemplaris TaxID=2072580 RepID=A0A1W0WT05_HYPEX|nr:hypothetical protein BV898_07542 [Hypsibius exemplaris]